MKTVAVLVPSFAVEYSLEFLAGIYDYFNEKDVRVLVAHSRYYHDTTGAFNYQYWSVINLLKSEEVDVVICASGMYTSTMSRDEIANELKSFLNKPVISVALDFDFEGCYSITQRINCDEIFYEIVNHLKTKHGCTNFAFLSANSLNSEEGNERYRAFLNAIKRCDLEFSSENEIEGKFVYEIAKYELKNKYKSKKDIKFDALIAANDAMAIAAMDYFAEIGIDVKLNVTDFSNWLDAIVNGKQQMYIGGWTILSGDVSEAFAAFHSKNFGAGGNRSFYANDEVDALIDIIDTETDKEKRIDACEELQQILADECVTIGLEVGTSFYSHSTSIDGFKLLPSQSAVYTGITFAE